MDYWGAVTIWKLRVSFTKWVERAIAFESRPNLTYLNWHRDTLAAPSFSYVIIAYWKIRRVLHAYFKGSVFMQGYQEGIAIWQALEVRP